MLAVGSKKMSKFVLFSFNDMFFVILEEPKSSLTNSSVVIIVFELEF
jgi:hypothetical protein